MKKKVIILIALCCLFIQAAQSDTLSITDLRTEQLTNPLGLDTPQPRFSWRLQSGQRNVMQTTYRLFVASSPELLSKNRADVWDSGEVRSDASIWISYQGPSLQPNKRYYWKVQITTGTGESAWSEPAFWGMGLMGEIRWKGRWFGMDRPMPWDSETMFSRLSARYVRKEFKLSKTIKEATLHISGLGVYECLINGERVGDLVLAPAPTDYRKTVLYNSYDVTTLLRSQADNAIGITLGNGRYHFMRQNYRTYKIHNFGYPKVRMNLIVEYTDGSRETIATDTNWKLTADGPIRSNNEFDGEEYDARKELGSWSETGYDDSSWLQAERVSIPSGYLRGQTIPGIKVVEKINPRTIRKSANGYILDMGQNMVGWLRIRVKGNAGDSVRLRFAETLQPDGELYTANLRSAKVTDLYILKGEGEEIWNPRFTFHGFRYVEITGWPGRPELEDIEGIRLSADLRPDGSFECSDPMLNRLHQVLDYTFLSNVFSVESDCPAREKFGYGGDIVGVSRTFCYFYNMHNFYQKAIRDFANDQRPSGGFPETAPYNGIADQGLGEGSGPIGWQLAFAFLQKQLYTYYGDTRIVRQFYPALKKQVDFLYSQSKDYLIDRCINDHESLDVRIPALFATAHFYHHAILITEFAHLLNRSDDEKLYADLALHIKEAFIRNFVSADGQIGNGTPAEQAFGLYYGLVPDDKKNAVGDKLITSIAERDYHVTSGIFGVPVVLTVLDEMGRDDIAWRMVTQKDFPGWGHMLTSGATTLWETWKYSDNVYSHNHPMFGSVGEWLYQSLGGIQATAPGFKEFRVKPFFVKNLQWMNCRYQSVYGEIRSEWKMDNGCYILQVMVPVNTQAKVYLPAQAEQITEGNISLREVKNIRVVEEKSNSTCVEVPSGVYSFKIPIYN